MGEYRIALVAFVVATGCNDIIGTSSVRPVGATTDAPVAAADGPVGSIDAAIAVVDAPPGTPDSRAPDAAPAACTIDFDSDCNVGAPGVCMTTWVGGNTCGPVLTACRSSGTFAFMSQSDITITSTVDLNTVSVYLVHRGADSSATMTFQDSQGQTIKSIASNADCGVGAGTPQRVVLPTPSRRVLVHVVGTAYIDDFVVNPP